ncbi:MAG TPA: DNA mismatch repair endonuclease MutL, partial [Thermomicrobiales bacterium]|nr:DNA mismatch repair endonuclease MutL [Thermomicrobiales bacterium]
MEGAGSQWNATPADDAAAFGDRVVRPPIRVLPAAVAARIAAGETIERPASVVKELVENALDAGARAIRIEARGGGLGLIRVADDGCGIRAPELWLACQRHATSKLAGGDLAGIRTLGFRGEALPSIAEVAELTLVSAADASGLGWRIAVRDGRVVVDEPAPRTRGTTATARQLFANVPARLAAAERAATEIAQIGQTTRRLALAAPAVRFTLSIDGRIALQTSGAGDLATALAEVYGGQLAGNFVVLGPETANGVVWRGLVAGPDVTRPGRSALHVIVNSRWAQPRQLLGQIEAAYRPLLPRGRHPILVAQIEVDPDRVDVNIHPTKLEVRLRDERAVGGAIGEAIRRALGRRPLPFGGAPATGVAALLRDAALAEETPGYDSVGPILSPGLPPLQLVGQLQRRLLLLEGDAGLYLVDQHRAHERILFERLRRAHAADEAAEPPRPLADPIVLELRPAQVARFVRRLDDLLALGFACELFGGRTFLLRAAPPLPGVLADAADSALAGLGEPDALAAALLALADDEDAAEG